MHKLRKSRESYGLAVKDLSILSDICGDAIRRIESGKNPHKVNEGVARALADALDTSVSALFAAHELTVLGRTPHTGGPISKEARIATYEKVCTACNLVYHVARGCGACEEAA